MDLSELKEDIMEVFEKHETRTGGKGLATDLAFLTVKDVASKKSKGKDLLRVRQERAEETT